MRALRSIACGSVGDLPQQPETGHKNQIVSRAISTYEAPMMYAEAQTGIPPPRSAALPAVAGTNRRAGTVA